VRLRHHQGEGDHVLDPDRLIDAAGCEANGIPWGCYHYAHEELGDGYQQAQFLWSACGDVMPDLGPMLDVESRKDANPDATLTFIRDFIRGCKDTFGRAPILYTYPAFWKTLGVAGSTASDLIACPLAIAQYPHPIAQYPHLDGNWQPGPADAPAKLAPWNDAWTFWQYTSQHTTPGVPTPCDGDAFNGDAAALRALCGLPALGAP
jgi:GH25 family lysozyme M1 (1,4-beta-N-acetylmuramidase)